MGGGRGENRDTPGLGGPHWTVFSSPSGPLKGGELVTSETVSPVGGQDLSLTGR